MSVRVMSMVWQTALTSTEKIVLLYYADRASDDGKKIFPSVKTVMKATSLSERAVQGTTKKLIQKGYLQHTGWSGYHTKLLTINIDKLSSEIGGGTESGKGVQQILKRGAFTAPKPSEASNNSSFRKDWKKKGNPKTQTVIEDKYIPIVNEEIKRALQCTREHERNTDLMGGHYGAN